MLIRAARDADRDAIWQIFRAVVATRDSYTFLPDTPRDTGVNYWFGADASTYVAEIDGAVAGMYKLIPNATGLGSHVSNASFMVDPVRAGQGIGRAMGLHALRAARAQGYEAMQFNFVVSTNDRAVALWRSLGFNIVGTLPRAFRHGTLGLVDAYVMHRPLDDIVLTFGQLPAGVRAIVRRSAYAVIANDAGQIAVVEAPDGMMLPGGGAEADEPLDAAAVREVAEECALRVRVRDNLGEAVQFVYSTRKAAHFEKRSGFVNAEVLGAAEGVAEHAIRWLPPGAAKAAVAYESHAWAIERWVRRSS